MKKTLLFASLLLAMAVTAQNDKKDKLVIEKGTWNLGGNFAIGFSDDEFVTEDRIAKSENVLISLIPNLGYTIADNVLVGMGLGYSYSKSENLSLSDDNIDNFNSSNSKGLIIAPFIRGYLPVGNKLAFFGQFETRFRRFDNEFNDESTNLTNSENKRNDYFLGIRPGLTFFVSKNIALETTLGSLGYSRAKFDSDGDRTGERDNFNFNLNSSDLFFGLSYYF